jgi:hypothetical protein
MSIWTWDLLQRFCRASRLGKHECAKGQIMEVKVESRREEENSFVQSRGQDEMCTITWESLISLKSLISKN